MSPRPRPTKPAEATDRASYLYAIVRAPARPRLGKVAGLPDAGPVRLVDGGGGLWLALADAPLARYSAEAIERGLQDLDWVSRCAIAHERVVEKLARAGDAAPMKLFTLFHGDERAVAHVQRARRKIERALGRVAGCAEWGARLAFDEQAARAEARAKVAAESARLTSGAAFLLGKKRQQEADAARATAARDAANEVFDALSAHARDGKRRPIAAVPAAGPRLVLDAVFLVGDRETAAFRRGAQALRRDLSAGFALTLTGPWPAYSFLGEVT